jgi:putative PEP-CTERM system TPR-repeat lipoprotein
VIELKNVLQASPDDAQSRFLLGVSYFELGQYDPAQKELEKALQFGYSATDVLPYLSKSYQRLGSQHSVFKLTAKAKGLTEKELAQIKLMQIKLYVDEGQHNKAQALIDEIGKMTNAGEYSDLALVYHLILQLNLEAALIQVNQVLETEPLFSHALLLKIDLLKRTEQFDEAIESYEQYISAYPREYERKFEYIQFLTTQRLFNKAEPIVDELLQLSSTHPMLLQIKASTRFSASDFEVALSYAESALDINAEDNTSRLIAGVSAYFSKDYEAAQTHLGLLASLLPPEHAALRMLADSQMRLNMSLQASETMQRIESITDQDAQLMLNIGQELARNGELKKAKRLLQEQPEQLNSVPALIEKAHLKFSLKDISGVLDLECAFEKVDDQIMSNLEIKSLKQSIEFILALAYYSIAQYDKV